MRAALLAVLALAATGCDLKSSWDRGDGYVPPDFDTVEAAVPVDAGDDLTPAPAPADGGVDLVAKPD